MEIRANDDYVLRECWYALRPSEAVGFALRERSLRAASDLSKKLRPASSPRSQTRRRKGRLPLTPEILMESSTATHAEGDSNVDARSVGHAPAVPKTRAGQRGAVLARMLLVGDALAATLAAAFAVLIVGLPRREGLIYVASAVILWPFSAFSIGLYRSDQLASWASAVPEVPRSFVAVLLITWPLFGIAIATRPRRDGRCSPSSPSLAIAAARRIARAGVRAGLHRSTDAAPAHADPRLRRRRRPGRREAPQQRPVRAAAGRHRRRRRARRSAPPTCPGSAASTTSTRSSRSSTSTASSSPSRGPATSSCWSAIRACRDAGVAVDVVPRLFEFLDGVRALDQVGGLPLLSIGSPTLTSVSMAAKRILDVVGSAALLLLFSPLMIVIAIAIKLESRGPDLLPPAARRPRPHQLPADQVPLDVRRRRAAQGGARRPERSQRRRHVQDPRRPARDPRRRASSAASRSTSCRSSSTSSRAR